MGKYDGIVKQLKKRRAELEERLNSVEQDFRKPYARDSEEQALEIEEEDVLGALDKGTRTELELIHNAFERIKRNEYRICVVCGETIPIKRLEALPYTDRCVNCAEEE